MATPEVAVREIEVREGISPATVRSLSEYVKSQYLDRRIALLSGKSYRESWSQDGTTVELDWSYAETPSLPAMEARLSIGPRVVSITFPGQGSAGEFSTQARQKVADDLELLVTTFLKRARGTSLYFAFSTGDRESSKEAPAPRSMGSETLKRILSGNMTNLYLLIMALSFFLFLIIGDYAIFAVIALQILALFYSDRLALMVGKVRPTAERPKVTVVSISVSSETQQLIQKYAKGLLNEIGKRLEGSVPSESPGGPEAVSAVRTTLSGVGIHSSPEDIGFVTRDVYGLVKRVADRFRFPVPKITIMNTVADNAAATGVSPNRSSIAITVGSLEDLDDDELTSVVGHELGHIKGRDSIILFCVTFFVYFGGLFLWYPLLLYLGLFYYIFAFAIIFSVGKILETRADTESVATLGEPGILAAALTKIGFRQLYVERYSSQARFLDWFTFDPHPPIYFRVQRLSKIAAKGTKIGNTFLLALRDCIMGFFGAV